LTKNKKNEFVNHLENKDELLKEKAKEKERQEKLKNEMEYKKHEYQKYSTVVLGVVIFLFVVIVGVWFVISRDKMLSMTDNFNMGAIEGFLHQIDEQSNASSFKEEMPDIDWNNLVKELKEKEDLTEEESAFVDKVLEEAENTNDVKEALSNILKEE